MSLQNRLRELEDEFDRIDRPVVRIFQKDRLVRLRDGHIISIDEYKSLVASGEISEFRKEVLVRRWTIKNSIIIKSGR